MKHCCHTPYCMQQPEVVFLDTSEVHFQLKSHAFNSTICDYFYQVSVNRTSNAYGGVGNVNCKFTMLAVR